MTTKKPEEPDWSHIIDEILETMAEEDVPEAPVGLGGYHFSEHSRNLNHIEAFDWNDEWIKARPILLIWLEYEFEEWWEEQAYEDEAWRGWLEGYEIRVRGDSYITELSEKLTALYRERITETHKCSICGKDISEKYPYGHPDHLLKQGYPDPDVYPDGKVPRGMPTDDIQWKHKLICEECWRRDYLNKVRK